MNETRAGFLASANQINAGPTPNRHTLGDAMAQVNMSIDRLDAAAKELEDRLRPILRVPGPSTPTPSASIAVVPPAVETALQQDDRLARIAAGLEAIINALAL